jgi:hypothetical protein
LIIRLVCACAAGLNSAHSAIVQTNRYSMQILPDSLSFLRRPSGHDPG